MGENADNMRNGIQCCQCGCWLWDLSIIKSMLVGRRKPPGYPIKCKDCEEGGSRE